MEWHSERAPNKQAEEEPREKKKNTNKNRIFVNQQPISYQEETETALEEDRTRDSIHVNGQHSLNSSIGPN